MPDPDELEWVRDFARIAWGETWYDDSVYPEMLDKNDVPRFKQVCHFDYFPEDVLMYKVQGVDAVWRSSRLNEPLESMLRHCYTNAGVISLRQSTIRCQVARIWLAQRVRSQIRSRLLPTDSSKIYTTKLVPRPRVLNTSNSFLT